MNTSENICQDLAATGLKSYIFLSRLGTPSLEMLHFCNSMSPSLDNDCTLQDLAFQVLKLFAGNSLIMDLSKNWIMSFMTWPSKTWTRVKIFVKTWLPQVWNLTYFFQDLACQVLKCYIFATPCPQVLAMIALFKTWLSKSWNFFAGNSLIMDLSKNWIMSFMIWSSKTWTQVKIFVKTWLPQVWNLTHFFQDLARQVLKCYIFATPCPQVLTMIALFKAWLSKSWNFLQETVWSWT